MKRILLVAILVFPVLTLIIWVYWGASRRHDLPAGTAGDSNGVVIQTNLNPR